MAVVGGVRQSFPSCLDLVVEEETELELHASLDLVVDERGASDLVGAVRLVLIVVGKRQSRSPHKEKEGDEGGRRRSRSALARSRQMGGAVAHRRSTLMVNVGDYRRRRSPVVVHRSYDEADRRWSTLRSLDVAFSRSRFASQRR